MIQDYLSSLKETHIYFLYKNRRKHPQAMELQPQKVVYTSPAVLRHRARKDPNSANACLGQDSRAASLTESWSRDIWNWEQTGIEFSFNEYNKYIYRSRRVFNVTVWQCWSQACLCLRMTLVEFLKAIVLCKIRLLRKNWILPNRKIEYIKNCYSYSGINVF